MSRHVFLSFAVEDVAAVNLFRGHAKNDNVALDFDDYSVKEPYDSASADYIKRQITEKIRAASVTICLFGQTTYTSSWVRWEVEKSVELGNKVIGVRLYADAPCPVPQALVAAKATILAWDI